MARGKGGTNEVVADGGEEDEGGVRVGIEAGCTMRRENNKWYGEPGRSVEMASRSDGERGSGVGLEGGAVVHRL